jgi:hypothetical protein
MAAVVFDPAEFRVFKPRFHSIPDQTLAMYFSFACGVAGNSDEQSPYPYSPETGNEARKWIIYYLMCHLLTMDENAQNGISGPLTSTAEGSVAAGFAAPPVSDRSFYSETPCGRAYLALIRPYAYGGVIIPANHCHPWG